MNAPVPIRGTGNEKTSGFFFDFYEQWSDLFKRQNWNDFTVIKIEGERALYSGRWELVLALLGLQVTIQYVFDDKFNREVTSFRDRIEADLKGRTGAKEVIDPTGALDDL